jgi:hypothetical protein
MAELKVSSVFKTSTTVRLCVQYVEIDRLTLSTHRARPRKTGHRRALGEPRISTLGHIARTRELYAFVSP